MLAPTVYDPDTARETLAQAMALIPVLLLAAATVAWLRERLQASEDRYRRLAELDPLTGVGNYRMLMEQLPVEVERNRRHGQQLALLVIDMNDFKRVNDEHGHQYGDGVLRDVAQSLEQAVRGHDLVVRQGGDEFAVVAPQTDRAQAIQLAGRLCEAVSGIEVKDRSLGACIGCAVFPEDADNVNELLAHADDDLRARKGVKTEISRGGEGSRLGV
ncbi:MAG: GGDEF domain-containing protein [Solirubrobacterales bacterium]|nr:GGDEF domain-containing protein [Solirubrobacterales bacterium]